MPFPDFATKNDILRASIGALGEGADAVMTARSMDVVEMLAREDSIRLSPTTASRRVRPRTQSGASVAAQTRWPPTRRPRLQI